MSNDVPPNALRFSGIAATYDVYRPTAPPIVAEILSRLAGMERPGRVVDLACGTGLSTRLWADRAVEVIGIEPNPEMRAQAEEATLAENVRYLSGRGEGTGLPDGYADIVTVSQAMHWLDPEPTLAEATRILRPGGVFSSYDYDWPPVMGWEIEAARSAFLHRIQEIAGDREPSGGTRWEKSGHLKRMEESGRFRSTREILAHHVETGNADRFIGQILSLSGVTRLLASGVREEDIGLDTLRAEANRLLGPIPRPWYWSYRIRVGVR